MISKLYDQPSIDIVTTIGKNQQKNTG